VFQEVGVLPNNIHDARGDNCLVLLAFLCLTQLQQSPKRADEKGTFLTVLDTAAERADDPRQRVQAIEIEIQSLLLLNF
jgi:hypothetical protein